MGVHGLWRLIEPSGKPVPLETLENKVLAVDVSIWLHQAIKGFQDSRGAPLPNAHLLGIYHRVCKLLYFKVKPVFVFDGGVPALKKQTIAKRNQTKSKNQTDANKLQEQLLKTILKHSAISKVLADKAASSIEASSSQKYVSHKKDKDDMYVLAPVQQLDSSLDSTLESDDDEDSSDYSPSKQFDLHTIDTKSKHFKSLPIEVRHDILTELKATRKQSSWGRIHELPSQSDDFSGYQMKRLLKRFEVQSALEGAEKEMGGYSLSLGELEALMNDQGVITSGDKGKRIASDENTRYLLIKDVKKAIEEAKISEEEKLKKISEEAQEEEEDIEDIEDTLEASSTSKTKADLEYEEDLQKAIALSLGQEPEVSNSQVSLQPSYLENFTDADFYSDSSEDFEESVKTNLSAAQSYMMEYSGLTPTEISKIMNKNNEKVSSSTCKYNKKLNIAHPETIHEIESDSESDFIDNQVVSSNSQIHKPHKHYLEEIPEENKKINANIDKAIKETGNLIETQKNNKQSEVVFSNSDDDFVEVSEEIKGTSTNNEEGASKSEVLDKIKGNNEPKEISSDSDDDFVEVDKEIKGASTNNEEGSSKSEVLDKIAVNNEPKEISSDSDDDFVEVNEEIKGASTNNEEGASKSSDSEDDFVEVLPEIKKTDEDKIEIVIDTKAELEEDLFSDIFESVKEEKTQEVNEKQRLVVDNKLSSTSNLEMEKAETGVVEEEPEEIPKDTPEANSLTKSDKMEDSNSMNVDVFLKPEVPAPKMTTKELTEMKDSLLHEKIDLMVEKSTKERLAGNITDQMYQEAQELLELFGVPYIIAPMEAEAQCAFLDEINLVDGTITDDSDIWLFGGKTVYKNFFNQQKYVTEFKAENIKHHFKLSREQMILLALLVGSDYTTGLQGIGPVTAMEILAAFPASKANEFSLSQSELVSGLKEFSVWMRKGKSVGGLGRNALKNKLKNVNITDNFPSLQVVEAYLDPKVETSKDKFSWSLPDIVALEDFAKIKFGWTSKKIDEILVPVIKKIHETKQQKTIKDFFKAKFKITSEIPDSKMSKRVKNALEIMGKDPSELTDEEEPKKKRSRKSNDKEKSTVKKPRKRKETEENNLKQDNVAKCQEDTGSKEVVVKAKIPESNMVEEGSVKGIFTEEGEDSKKNAGNDTNLKSKAPIKSKVKTIDLEKNISEGNKPKGRAPRKQNVNKKEPEKINKDTKIENVSTTLEVIKETGLEKNNSEDKKPKERAYRKRKVNKNDPVKINKDTNIENVSTTSEVIKEKIDRNLRMDEEIKILQATSSTSEVRVREIDTQLKKELENVIKIPVLPRPSPVIKRTPNFHKKERVHQREMDKSAMLRSRMKAIEIFRKSKKGPGFVGKRDCKKQSSKEDAELSENSSDE